MNRVIRKSRAQSASEVKDLLCAIFAAELVLPSECLWLVTPWVSDVELLDNTAGTFKELSRFGRRKIRLAEVLGELALRGATIILATNSDVHNNTFRRRLEFLAHDLRVSDRIRIEIDNTDALHAKTLTGDDFALMGSMNFTYSGIELREEQVELRTDTPYVMQARMDMRDRFGGP